MNAQVNFKKQTNNGCVSYLSFCEAKAVGELFSFCSHHVMVFLKRVFEPQELRRWKSCPDSFGLSGQRVVQKKALRTRFITWKRAQNEGSVTTFILIWFDFLFLTRYYFCNKHRACAQLWDNNVVRADWKHGTMLIVSEEKLHIRQYKKTDRKCIRNYFLFSTRFISYLWDHRTKGRWTRDKAGV